VGRTVERRFFALTLILAGCGIGGCTKREVPVVPPPEVTVATPVQKDTTTYYEFTGTTRAIESVEIRARVEGYLQSIEFEPSAEVKAGDLLFVIDPAEYQAALAKAEAGLELAEAELQNAEWEMERMQEMVEQNAAHPREIQKAITARDLAKAQMNAARAAVEKAQLDVDYTQISSPIDGMVSRNLVDVGNLVGAGERTVLTSVVKMDPMYVYFNVPERVLVNVLATRGMQDRQQPNRELSVSLSGETGFSHAGRMDYIDNTVDAATGTIQVRGVLPNEEGRLFPGLFVRIRVPAKSQPGSILVEERAIGTDLGGKYVLVVNDKNIVEQQPVEIGALVEGGMRVITEGLSPGERYIVNGLQRARPGLPVKPQMEEATPAPVAPQNEQTPGQPEAEVG
jgi:RND family efflux transporter MFP subunit